MYIRSTNCHTSNVLRRRTLLPISRALRTEILNKTGIEFPEPHKTKDSDEPFLRKNGFPKSKKIRKRPRNKKIRTTLKAPKYEGRLFATLGSTHLRRGKRRN
jgi:hypothetical protein